MVHLTYTASPAHQANWSEVLYDKSYRVVNGQVETDNHRHIEQLVARGFSVTDEDYTPPKVVYPTVSYEVDRNAPKKRGKKETSNVNIS